MSNLDSGVDHRSAPQDYAELFRVYYDYVVNLVRRSGIDEDRKEDVASEILLRFYEKRCLETFDPTMVFVYNGRERPARFRSFLSRFVLAYVRGFLERQQIQAKREPLICDKTFTVGMETERWVNVYGPQAPDIAEAILDIVECEEIVDAWRERLAEVPKRFENDTCDLPALLDAVVEQVLEYGIWDVPKLCERFDNRNTRMHDWLWHLRACLSEITDREVPAKRPRVVKKKAVTA